MISGFRRNVNDMVDLLECYAAMIGSYHVSGQLVGHNFF